MKTLNSGVLSASRMEKAWRCQEGHLPHTPGLGVSPLLLPSGALYQKPVVVKGFAESREPFQQLSDSRRGLWEPQVCSHVGQKTGSLGGPNLWGLRWPLVSARGLD